jgi:serine protease Do
MTNKKLNVRLVAAAVLILVAGLSFQDRVSSTEAVSAQKGLESGQRFSLPAAIRETSGLAQAASYSAYTRITDNEEKISVEVPVEWIDIETGTWKFKGKDTGVFLAASPNLGEYYASASQPGVLIGVSRSLAQSYDRQSLLALEKRDAPRTCVYRGRFEYQNQFYSGEYDHFTNCATNSPGLLIFTTSSADHKSLILIRIVVQSDADLEAVDKIINTFQVLGDPERDEHHE